MMYEYIRRDYTSLVRTYITSPDFKSVIFTWSAQVFVFGTD